MASGGDTLRFFELLHGAAIGPESLMVLWTLPDRASVFFDNIEAAAAHAIAEDKNQKDVYVGMGLLNGMPKPNPKTGKIGRGAESDVYCINAMWADIDIDAPHRKKGKTCCPSFKAATDLVTIEVGLQPSMIVDSGYGLHAYWLLSESETIENGDALEKLKDGTRLWWATVAAAAGVHGWSVDSTHDVARVLRVPGTSNWKIKESPVPVRLVEGYRGDVVRYHWPSDFQDVLIAAEYAPDAPAIGKYEMVSCVSLRPDASPDQAMIDALCEVDRKFKLTWERKRNDLKDNSASGYDLSLTNILVTAGWNDQQIADAIMAWRRRHSMNPEKARRRDYIMRTIGIARSRAQADEAIRELEMAPSPAAVGGGVDNRPPKAGLNGKAEVNDRPVITEPQRINITSKLSKALGIELRRAIRHGEENSTYSFEVGKGDSRTIVIGNIGRLMSDQKVRESIAEATGVIIRQFTKPQWFRICENVLAIATTIENEESSLKSGVREWMHLYLTQKGITIVPEEMWQAALQNGDPFWRGGEIWMQAKMLARFIRLYQAERIEYGPLYEGMRQLGFRSARVTGRPTPGDDVICRSYWHGDAAAVGLATRRIKRSSGDEGGPGGLVMVDVSEVGEASATSPAGGTAVLDSEEDEDEGAIPI